MGSSDIVRVGFSLLWCLEMGQCPAVSLWSVVQDKSLWGGPVSWCIEIIPKYFQFIGQMYFLLIHMMLGSLKLDPFIYLLILFFFLRRISGWCPGWPPRSWLNGTLASQTSKQCAPLYPAQLF
jgi:hypothetical protein